MSLLRARFFLIKELHEARNSADPKRMKSALEAAESQPALDLKDHIDYTRLVMQTIEDGIRSTSPSFLYLFPMTN